jgi:hypothetical protein
MLRDPAKLEDTRKACAKKKRKAKKASFAFKNKKRADASNFNNF